MEHPGLLCEHVDGMLALQVCTGVQIRHDEICVLMGHSFELPVPIDSRRIEHADNPAYELTGQSVSGVCCC